MGVAREDGIEVAGHSRPLGFSAFEAASGSTLRRPAANIWTTKGDTLVELMARAVGKEPLLRRAPQGQPQALRPNPPEECF